MQTFEEFAAGLLRGAVRVVNPTMDTALSLLAKSDFVDTASSKTPEAPDQAVSKAPVVESGFVGTPEQEAARNGGSVGTPKAPRTDYQIDKPSPATLNFAYTKMAESEDIIDKIEAATAVQAIAHQLISYKMPEYHNAAQASLGLGMIDQQIQASMLADSKDANNPHDGTWSSRTEALMQRRQQVLGVSIATAKEFAVLDPQFNAPLVAADAVLKSAGALGIREDRARKASDHSAVVNSITDTEARSYAFITGQNSRIDWNNPQSVYDFKAAILPDKEFQKLTQTGLLSLNDAQLARNVYADARDPVSKSRASAVIARMEAEAIGLYDPGLNPSERMQREVTARQNLDLFQKAYNSDVASPRFKKLKDSELTATAAIPDTKQREQAIRGVNFKYKDLLLQEYQTQKFVSDVSDWKGMDLADPAVSMSIAEARKLSGHRSVTLDEFTSQFLYQNNGLALPQKVQQLQSYIRASASGASTSSILPDIDGDAISKQIAPGMIRRIWEELRK